MKRSTIIILILLCCTPVVSAQKMSGAGAEISTIGLKLNYRNWLSRTKGFELFGGITSEFDDLMPNDPEAGFKYLHTFIYNRSDRSYLGFMGKWKWVDIDTPNKSTSLPVPGILVGKEWFKKKRHLRGMALEVGYQFGNKKYKVYSPENHIYIGKYTFSEVPLIFNFRYSFYSKR